MKKVGCLLLAALLCCSLTACVGTGSDDAQSGKTTTTTEVTTTTIDRAEIAKQTLQEAYDLYRSNFLGGSDIELSSDGLSLSIDTRTSSMFIDQTAELFQYIKGINEYLSLPSSLNTKMERTRALDGTLSETYDDYEVTWSYHPDSGLGIIYEVIC